MEKMKTKILLNHVFILGLILLIVNDHFLKDLYGNFITGKISDFAGVLIFPMFLKFIFRLTTKKSIFFTIVFFIYWKSGFSQSLIDTINSIFWIRFDRVIDYTDLVAFIILPLSYYALENLEKIEIKIELDLITKITANLVLTLSVVSFLATSISCLV